MNKKIYTLLLVLILCISMVAITGCSKSKTVPYSEYDLTEYITLPDYEAYTTSEPEVNITDEDIDAEIEERVEAAATEEKVTEGTVEEGDDVTISYKGTLEDGSTQDGMNSDSYDMTLGSANMIDGFQEGLYGAKIGETITLNLQFPDPYEINEELSGQKVTFEVVVLSKNVSKAAEFNADFIKKDSGKDTEEEYRTYLKEVLEQESYDNQLYNLKYEIYSKIVEETELIKTPETEYKAQLAELDEQYKAQAESYGYEWDAFRDAYFQMTQEEYETEMATYAEQIVKQEMIIYAIAQKEDLKISDKEQSEYLSEMLTQAGFENESDFEEYAGMTLDEYAVQYKLDRDMLLTKELDAIYDKLEKK